jgi:AsmA protein
MTDPALPDEICAGSAEPPATMTISARKAAFFGISLCGLAVLALGLVNLNTIIERNKNALVSRAEQALGRKLSVGSIRVSFWSGIRLSLKDVVVADDPDFSSESFLRAGALDLSVKLLPLLTKDLQIERVTLHDPEIAIIRDEEGLFNFSTIGKPERRGARGRKAAQQASGQEGRGVRALMRALIDVTGGKLRYIDKKERMNLPLSAIDFSSEEEVQKGSFAVRLSAAFLTEKPNLKVEARVGPFADGLALADIPLDALITIDPLDGDKLNAAAPRLKSHLPGGWDFSGQFTLKNMRIKGTLRELNLGGVLDPNTLNLGSFSHSKHAGRARRFPNGNPTKN